MLRSKATEALLRLKEIDKKYKIKSNQEVKLRVNSSLSDISTVENNEVSHNEKMPDNAINARPKLDIRMPDAHIMDRIRTMWESEAEMDAIFIDEPVKIQSVNQPKQIASRKMNIEEKITDELLSPGLETVGENLSDPQDKTSSENRSLTMSEEQVVNAETSVSEDVPEVISSSHPVSNNLEADAGKEITAKTSVDSIIDADEMVQSDLDEDPSTLVPSGTYSDDFVQTFSTEDVEEANSIPGNDVEAEILKPELISSGANHDARTSPRPGKKPRSEVVDIEEQVVSVCEKVDHDVSEESKNSLHLLRQRSSKSSSARSSKERRRRRSPDLSSASRDSKSREFSSSLKESRDSKTKNTSGSSNQSKINSQRNSQVFSRADLSEEEKRGMMKPSAVFFPQTQEDRSKTKNNEVASSKTKKSKPPENDVSAKDSWSKESPPNYSKESKTQESTSAIKPVPATMLPGDGSRFPRFSKKCEDNSRSETRTSKYRDNPHGRRRRSRIQKMDDKNKRIPGILREGKSQLKEKPAGDADRLEQKIKELQFLQERDRLRSRVRSYVMEIINEERRLAANDHSATLCGSINELYDHRGGSTGLGQSANLHQCFFKPLDLPNVAGFKRPDNGDEQFSHQHNERYLNINMIRERIIGIRYWLKQQFILYRDYSNLVSTINEKYIPVTLKETKKMISDMQRFYDYS